MNYGLTSGIIIIYFCVMFWALSKDFSKANKTEEISPWLPGVLEAAQKEIDEFDELIFGPKPKTLGEWRKERDKESQALIDKGNALAKELREKREAVAHSNLRHSTFCPCTVCRPVATFFTEQSIPLPPPPDDTSYTGTGKYEHNWRYKYEDPKYIGTERHRK